MQLPMTQWVTTHFGSSMLDSRMQELCNNAKEIDQKIANLIEQLTLLGTFLEQTPQQHKTLVHGLNELKRQLKKRLYDERLRSLSINGQIYDHAG